MLQRVCEFSRFQCKLRKQSCTLLHKRQRQEVVPPEDKEYSGLSPCLTKRLRHSPILIVNGSKDNLNFLKQATFIGSSSSHLKGKAHFAPSPTLSAPRVTMNSPDQSTQASTCGKNKQESPEPNSNSAKNLFKETSPKTGNRSGKMLKKEILWQSRRRFDFRVTGLSNPLRQTLLNQLEWCAQHTFIGVQLEQESHGMLGHEQEWMLTLKIPEANSGAVTEARRQLSSMNFAEASISHTCSDGWTVTLSCWKLKGHQQFMQLKRSTSPQMWTPEPGTQN